MASRKTTLHIGCGDAPHLSTPSERLVLVEPNPAFYNSLKKQTQHLDQVDVRAVAVSSVKGSAEFQVLNFEALSGVYDTAAISSLFPGLTVEKVLSVPTLSPKELLNKLEITGKKNTLICEAADVSWPMLKYLSQSGLLERFGNLELICAVEPFFGSGTDALHVRVFLEARGFRLVEFGDNQDADFHRLVFKFDPALSDAVQRSKEQEKLIEILHSEIALSRNGEGTSKGGGLTEHRQALLSEIDELKCTIQKLRQIKDEVERKYTELLNAPSLLARDLEDLRIQYRALWQEKQAQDILLAQVLPYLENIEGSE